jgi:hypothetical protein
MARADIVVGSIQQKDAILEIIEEREFQDRKFGPGSNHTIGEWILIMESELAEAKVALIKGGKGRDSVLQEIVQVCAVGVACLEQHGTAEVGRMQPIVQEPDQMTPRQPVVRAFAHQHADCAQHIWGAFPPHDCVACGASKK